MTSRPSSPLALSLLAAIGGAGCIDFPLGSAPTEEDSTYTYNPILLSPVPSRPFRGEYTRVRCRLESDRERLRLWVTVEGVTQEPVEDDAAFYPARSGAYTARCEAIDEDGRVRFERSMTFDVQEP